MLSRAAAPAKINLALVVGAVRADGKHEVATILQRIDLCDEITLTPSGHIAVSGFEDTIVREALTLLAERAGADAAWEVTIRKRIPVAAGLGGGSSDAAASLRIANETLPEPLPPRELAMLAARVGSDVPFFLTASPQLGLGDGSELTPLELPLDYVVALVLPRGPGKGSTREVYERYDRGTGARGYAERRAKLFEALSGVNGSTDLAALPPNELASSSLSRELLERGAFRADVSGAGPVIYGLFANEGDARAAVADLREIGSTWLASPLP